MALLSFETGKSNGGKPESLSLWQMKRAYCLNRDENMCQFCMSRGQLHVHHVIPRHISGNDSLENLVTLCQPCHKKMHGKDFRFIWKYDPERGLSHERLWKRKVKRTTKMLKLRRKLSIEKTVAEVLQPSMRKQSWHEEISAQERAIASGT